MAARRHDEFSRKLLHVAMGGFALSLRYVEWWHAALLAMAALIFNLFILPRLAGHLYRPDEHVGSARSGIVLYPISVLLLVLVFPTRLDIAAAAWAILAVGDGMATIAGRRLGWGAIPWNREKSFAGSFALFFFGGLAGALLALWCRPNVTPAPELWFSVVAPFVAALVAAFVETIPVRLDDNISVPASAAAVLWALSLVREDFVGAGARCCGSHRRPSRGREHHRRVAGLSRSHGDRGGRRNRRRHRHRDRSYGRLAGLGVAPRDLPRGSDQLAAGPASQDAPRHRRGTRRTPRRWERDRQYRFRDGCRAAFGRHARTRSGRAGLRRGAGRGRERHHRQRDRQGVGTTHLARADLSPRAARDLGRDVARGHRRRHRRRLSSRGDRHRGRARASDGARRRASPARRSARSPRACSARRSRHRVS